MADPDLHAKLPREDAPTPAPQGVKAQFKDLLKQEWHDEWAKRFTKDNEYGWLPKEVDHYTLSPLPLVQCRCGM